MTTNLKKITVVAGEPMKRYLCEETKEKEGGFQPMYGNRRRVSEPITAAL